MAYCGPRGVPYTEFIGGPPGWDDLSRALAIAWQERESSRHTCGVPRGDWYLDDGTPNEDAYYAKKDLCPGCSKLAAVDVEGAAKGTYVHLLPNPSAPRWANYGRG